MHYSLHCSNCHSQFQNGALRKCPACQGALECVYPEEALADLDESPRKGRMKSFLSLLPVDGPLSSLEEGGTPLLPSHQLRKKIGT